MKQMRRKNRASESAPSVFVNGQGRCSVEEPVSPDLSAVQALVHRVYAHDNTLVCRDVSSPRGAWSGWLIYFDGMCSGEAIYNSLIRPLLTLDPESVTAESAARSVLYNGEIKQTGQMTDCFSALADGDAVLFLDGSDAALIVSVKGFPVRSVTEPEMEKSLSGPREGFTESVLMNTALLHRKLKTVDFRAEAMTFGTRTASKAYLCYLGSIARPELVSEVRRRLKKICMDGVLDSNYIAEQIADCPASLMRTVGTTEKPDKAAADLLEGKVALIVDGSPVVLLMPYLFVESFHDAEDYYTNYYYAAVGRFLRMVCFFFTVSTPAVFIALVSFHQEMLPTDLALSIAQARSGVPLPVTLECFLMIAVFDLLREASQRLPSSIAQTLGIVGAIVVGEAAVEARFIGATTLIVVAFAGICGLMLPKLKEPVIYVRVLLLLSASVFGFYGILAAGLILIVRLMDLSSFGVPYLTYFFSPRMRDQKDVLIRAPWRYMKTRPHRLAEDEVRMDER